MIFIATIRYTNRDEITAEVYANCKQVAEAEAARDARRNAHGRKIERVTARPK